MITRMFGCTDLARGALPLGAEEVAPVDELESPSVSAAALIASPAPASTPPAISPPLRNARRSTLLCCCGSMLSIRALILGPAVAVGLGLTAQAAAAAETGSTCAPTTLDNSALQDGLVTVSPLAGSRV